MKSLLKKIIPLFVLPAIVIGWSACREKGDYTKTMHDPFLYNKVMHELNYVIIYDIFTPPVASRVFAYSNLAAYEVLAKEGTHLQSLEGKIKDLGAIPPPADKSKIDFPFASIIAMTRVGENLTFSKDMTSRLIDSVKNLAKDAGMPGNIFDESVAYGEKVASVIMEWSKKDNYAQTRGAKFSVTGLEGHWTPTPPGYFDAVEPKWMTLRCLAMDSANQFKLNGPPPFSKDPNSDFYKAVLDVMQTGNKPDTLQKWIANFWDCNSFKMHVEGHLMFATKAMTPPGHWMEIVGTIAKLKNADFYQTVYSYTAAAMGMYDGFIASWWCKYNWDLIRPETYINTYIDKNWAPYLQTPPFPEYTSAHSTISAAAATILGRIYGDNISFRDSSERDWNWPDRSFPSLDSAAYEVSMSRYYGGIHYFFSVQDGYEQGKKIGNLVIDKYFDKAKQASASK